jgi:N-methylhydantoinase B
MYTGVDPVTVELIKGALLAARQEMEAVIERTAMSPFIREKKDYFTAYFDREGNLVAGTTLPMASNLIECIFEHYPSETMRDGDLYWYNDPYGSHGAVSHMPDMVMVAPVFHQGRLCAFAEAWGHLWDIGGLMPGSISPDALETFHEGVLMPPVKIYDAGVRNDEVFRVFIRNSRFPEMVRGDLNAILASCRLGRRRMEELLARFGVETAEGAFEAVLHQTESAVRQALETKVPNGTYAFQDYLDSDAVSDTSYRVHLKMEKDGGNVTLDFTETDDQARGAVNFLMHSSVPKFMYGLYLTADDPSVLINSGIERAFGEVRTRPGSLVQPRFPAPVGMRSHTMIRVNNAVLGTLALATGGQSSAASSVYVLYYLRSHHRETGTYDLCIEGLAVGFGARPFADGIDAVYYVAQKNYPIEFAEMEFGVRVEGYRMHTDSGGPGRWRGGAGIVRDIRVIGDEAVLGLRVENVKYPCWGVNGGHGGRPGRVVVNPGQPDERELRPISDQNRLRHGDIVRISTAGGGGWGSPLLRPAEQVRMDVLDGFISAESALTDYGVVLSGDGLAVDAGETDKRRRELQGGTRMFHRGAYFEGDEARR